MDKLIERFASHFTTQSSEANTAVPPYTSACMKLAEDIQNAIQFILGKIYSIPVVLNNPPSSLGYRYYDHDEFVKIVERLLEYLADFYSRIPKHCETLDVKILTSEIAKLNSLYSRINIHASQDERPITPAILESCIRGLENSDLILYSITDKLPLSELAAGGQHKTKRRHNKKTKCSRKSKRHKKTHRNKH